MPTLIIDNVPVSLFDRIQHLAKKRQRTPADTALEALEQVFHPTTPTFSEAPLPSEPYMTEDICAPFSIPRPEGKPTRPVRVSAPVPTPHDIPDEE